MDSAPMLPVLTNVVPSVIMGICFLVGLPGNIAVMVVISRKYQADNFSLKLMMSLAVSDLLSLLFLPVQFYNLMTDWELGDVACRLLFFLLYWSIHASVFSVTMLSIQRYLQVLHTHWWTRLQVSGQWALLVALWAMAASISTPCLTVRSVQNSTCTVRYEDTAQETVILAFQTLFGYAIPFAAIVSLYICLQKRVSQMVILRTRRMTRLVTNIVASFAIFWTPLHFFNLLALIALASQSKELTDVCNNSFPILTALAFINACLNPFLYAFAHSQLQTTAVRQHKTQPSIHIPRAIPIPR